MICDTCLRGKKRMLAFASHMAKRSNDALKVVYYDICGPF